jgi:hypothetical protein
MRLLPLVVIVASAAAGTLVVEACSSESAPSIGPETDAAGGGETGPGSSDGSIAEDGAASTDGALTDACALPPPSLDGGGACGTMEFGAAAAAFGPVDGGADYLGGIPAAGVYDAVIAERASGAKGSWRETLVLDGVSRFTRIRQIDTGLTDASLGPVTRRSGTYTANGTTITMIYDCAQSDGVVVDGGSDTLPYDAPKDGTACGTSYRYGVSGIRITLKRR